MFGQLDQFGEGVGFHLAHQGAAPYLHSDFADAQPCGDLFIRPESPARSSPACARQESGNKVRPDAGPRRIREWNRTSCWPARPRPAGLPVRRVSRRRRRRHTPWIRPQPDRQGLSSVFLVAAGQGEVEGSTRLGVDRGPDTAIMGLDNRAANSQPDAHAFVLGGVEGVEDPLAVLPGPASALVANREVQLIAWTVFDMQLQKPPIRIDITHSVHSIHGQVQQHLLNLYPVRNPSTGTDCRMSSAGRIISSALRLLAAKVAITMVNTSEAVRATNMRMVVRRAYSGKRASSSDTGAKSSTVSDWLICPTP